eukprot:scaffold10259_cov49-Phaeocystis_antarctica.AAC.4
MTTIAGLLPASRHYLRYEAARARGAARCALVRVRVRGRIERLLHAPNRTSHTSHLAPHASHLTPNPNT